MTCESYSKIAPLSWWPFSLAQTLWTPARSPSWVNVTCENWMENLELLPFQLNVWVYCYLTMHSRKWHDLLQSCWLVLIATSVLNQLLNFALSSPAWIAFTMNCITVRRVLATTGNKKELRGTTLKAQLYLIQGITQRALGAKILFQVVGLSCILSQYRGRNNSHSKLLVVVFWTVQLIDSELSFCLVKDISTYSHWVYEGKNSEPCQSVKFCT